MSRRPDPPRGGHPPSHPVPGDGGYRAPLLAPEAVARLGRLRLRLTRRVAGRFQGAHRAHGYGGSQDFADYREYTPGDDPRLLDRHAYARLGKRLVKLYAAEDTAALRVVVDSSASMAFGGKWRTAGAAAAALATVAAAGGDRVRVLLAGDRLDPGPWFAGPGTVGAVLARLDGAAPATGTTDLVTAVRLARAEGAAGPTALVTDALTEDWEEVVRALGASPADALLVHLLGREDLEPRLEGDVRLTDAETGAEIELAASPAALQRHAAIRDAWLDAVERACGARGVAYARLLDDEPAETLVTTTLVRLGLVA